MSYNGSGVFQINSSGQPVVTGTVISSTAFNALTADLATGLSTAITKDGQTTTTSRILFAQGISSTLVTDATSATTGSIITAGGISTQKALWVGTTSTLIGLVGINTSTPSDFLTVAGGLRSTGATPNANVTGALFDYSGGNARLFSYTSTGSDMLFYTNASAGNVSEKMRITSAGNLSIGTTATEGFFTVAKASPTNGRIAVFTNGVDTNIIFPLSTGLSGIGTGTATPFLFYTDGTERARIDTSGNLLVGKTSDVNTSTGLALRATGESRYSVAGAASNTTMAFFRNGSAGESGSITTTSTTTSYVTSSDYRLKENVLPMTGGLATVAALKPVTYDWISNGSAGEGFIAHELQAVIPAAASGEKDAVNEDGSIKPQGVDFGKIVPHLVAGMQEQQAIITDLTTRLATLENK